MSVKNNGLVVYRNCRVVVFRNMICEIGFNI